MPILSRWFGSRHDAADDTPSSALVNPATQASARSLIALQQAARKLRLDRPMPASAVTAGNHFSRFRGRGMDYSESRIYQAGDDIRSMDWRVTARAGKPHTKLYQEERERPVMLLPDFSQSLFFGSRHALKSVIAAQTAALLGWASIAQGDRVGGLIFNDRPPSAELPGDYHELTPRRGQPGALRLIRELTRFSDPRSLVDAPPATLDSAAFNGALERLRRITRPGSLIFLISDFQAIDDETERHLRRLRQHNDLLAIQILDPLEQQAPPPGRYAVTDGVQTGVLDTRSPRQREAYEAFFRRRHQQLAGLTRRQRIPLLRLSTTDDPAQALQAWFGGTRRPSLQARQEAA